MQSKNIIPTLKAAASFALNSWVILHSPLGNFLTGKQIEQINLDKDKVEHFSQSSVKNHCISGVVTGKLP